MRVQTTTGFRIGDMTRSAFTAASRSGTKLPMRKHESGGLPLVESAPADGQIGFDTSMPYVTIGIHRGGRSGGAAAA